jgi:acetyl esterase/lipase
MKKFILFFLLITHILSALQMYVHLYECKSPGSENWTWKEARNNKNSVKTMTVYNVVHPTLTIFSPDPSISNGTAIIVCPGGGFHFLAIDHEGSNIAKSLVKKGITVFLLKYRLVHIFTDNPFDDFEKAEDKRAGDDAALPIIPLAIADGRQAIAYVRSHVSEYNLIPERIGIMGFSGGGMVAASTAFDYTPINRPDFVVPVYADLPESRLGPVLPDAPPLYIVCAQDDEYGFTTHAINMYNKWYASKRPAEMHLFGKGGHGFGVGDPANTTHNWLDQFGEWLKMQGLMTAK